MGHATVQSPAGYDRQHLTAAKLGERIFALTPREDSQSVTPVDFKKPAQFVGRQGATGNGVADNTAALLKVIAAMPVKGAVVEFEPDGLYMMSVATLGLLIDGKTGFHIRGNGATIKMLDGEPVNGSDQMLFFQNCTDGLIENLTLDANRAGRTPAETTAHTIEIWSGCRRLVFNNVRSINGVTDGWIIGTQDEDDEDTYPQDILLQNCEGVGAYRNGLSIIGGKRIAVRGGRYCESTGTLPKCGIDIEPDATTEFGNEDILIDGVEVSDNDGHGILVTVSGGSPPDNKRVVLRNIRGQGNALGLIGVAAVEDITIDGVECGPHATLTAGAISLNVGTITRAVLRNLTFQGITANGAGNSCLFVHSSVAERCHVDGFRATNVSCRLIECAAPLTAMNLEARGVTLDNAILLAGGTRSVLRNINIIECSGRALYAEAAQLEIDGFTCVDVASTTAAIHLATGSTLPIVRNVAVIQTGAVPTGAKGLLLAEAPAVVQNFYARAVGTDYDSTNGISFAGGTSGAVIDGCRPDPLVTRTFLAPIRLGATISPTQIAANTNDYNPTGASGALTMRLSSDAARDLTGIAGGADGRVLQLFNVGNFAITLKNDATSTAANRFLFSADIVLDSEEGITLWYDTANSRWRSAGRSN